MKAFSFPPCTFLSLCTCSQGEEFLIIGLPRVHLLLLNRNISEGHVWDSSNRRKYYRFNKVLMGAVPRDTFTVVNDSLIQLHKQLGPIGFSRQGSFLPTQQGKQTPLELWKICFSPPLAENGPTPALAKYLPSTISKAFFHSFCGSSHSRSQSLCLLSSSFFCCKNSSSFSSCCSISNSFFIWSGFGIWVLCNFYGFFFGEDFLYKRPHFLFFYKKAPAPFQQFVHFFDLFAALLVLFPLLLGELFQLFDTYDLPLKKTSALMDCRHDW